MDDAISNILEKLEEQSNKEKSRQVDVAPEDRMLAITKETGELLNIILRLKKAQKLLEVGMSVGYSTVWCAEAILEQDGKIITIEKNPNKIKRAKENFEQAGISESISIKEGIAENILSELGSQEKYQEYFDFVLIDADKENIIKYFDAILPMVKTGGVIVTDNMLYPEKYREEMKKFSDYLRENNNLRTITSPIGNGEEITIKLR